MELELRDVVALTKSVVDNFDIENDKNAHSRIMEGLARMQQVRDATIRHLQDDLHKLSRQHTALDAQLRHLADAQKEADHASRNTKLDTLKFRTAKAASDAEAETERLASQAADLAARLEELDLEGVEGRLIHGQGSMTGGAARAMGDVVDDEVLLRLKIYRTLGIEIERDDDSGEWRRAVVRNDDKGDVHVVNMDKKFSRFFYANYFWKTL
ncbi:hypothetical protein CDD82_618 [Ophiocordyceps australis]|uniref:Kinetochore protein Spc24 n=1 Tax=Ophiocordyceps australis TaxID=1399860 RepID=A0A2C5YHX3_9HYPO|nr:hypothetical protein CDD82_618 [Ophiocordyceps australis]